MRRLAVLGLPVLLACSLVGVRAWGEWDYARQVDYYRRRAWSA